VAVEASDKDNDVPDAQASGASKHTFLSNPSKQGTRKADDIAHFFSECEEVQPHPKDPGKTTVVVKKGCKVCM
jgi:hypothetical protein